MKFILLLLLFLSLELSAFDTGFGYELIMPDQPIGFSLFSLNNSTGIYLDINLSKQIDHNAYYDNVSINKAENIFHDTFIKKQKVWNSFGFGVTQYVLNNFQGFATIGITRYFVYRQYKDDYEMLGDNGKYWITDDSKTKVYFNISAGSIFNISDYFYFQLGYNLAPSGLKLGLGFLIKR